MPRQAAELTRSMTLVLIALSRRAGHGYVIMNAITRLTDGEYRVNAGTLYRSLAQMVGRGLVEEAPEFSDPFSTDQRRKYYRITFEGREELKKELQRMENLLAKVKRNADGL